jgi:hypothetical protein
MPKGRYRYKLDNSIGNPSDWTLTFAIDDNVAFNADCAFCGQTEQRLTYEVRRETESRWICQRCVSRYPIEGQIKGVSISSAEARNRLHGLSMRLKQNTCRHIISAINRDMKDPAIVEAAAYYDRNVQLSPRHAATLFAALSDLDQRVDVRLFDVRTRSRACQEEFGELMRSDRALIWPALSAQQQQRLAALGYAPFAAGRTGRRISAETERLSYAT